MEKLLHTEKWMPQPLKEKAKELQRQLNVNSFSQHLYDHLSHKDRKHNYTETDIVKTIGRIIEQPLEPFEIKIDDNNEIIKYCVRTMLNKDIDITIVVSNQNRIITAWLNAWDDDHETLDLSKYYRP